MNPIVQALIAQLRKRELDIEYRGEEDRIYLVGKTQEVDEPTRAAITAAKKRLIKDILKPAYEQSAGQPVRLPQVDTGDD
jgi:hypothetical protein